MAAAMPGKGERARARHEWRGAGQRRDHVAAGLGLPEGVDDRAAAAADMAVVPLPRGRVDRLAHRAEDAQAGKVVPAWVHLCMAFRGLDQRADRRRRGVEDADLVVLDHLPEAPRVGVGGNAFEDDLGGAHRERAVGDVGVPGDPADVGGAPEHVGGLQVEGPLHRHRRMQQVAAARVLHTLGLAGRARGVEQEQRMLGRDPLRLAGVGLAAGQLVQPQVARRLEGDLSAGAPIDDDVPDRLAPAERERLVDDGLQRQRLAAAQLLVGRDHDDGAGTGNAVAQRLRGEAAEDHRMRRADARAGLHRDHGLDRHRHVDDDAIALGHAERLQRIGHAASPGEQFAVAHARDLAVVGLEDDGGLVAEALLDLAVEAVPGDIERAVLEPLEERCVRVVERLRERRLPAQELAREPAPEPGVVGLGLAHQLLVGGHARHMGLGRQVRRWRVDSDFLLAHLVSLLARGSNRLLPRYRRAQYWGDEPARLEMNQTFGAAAPSLGEIRVARLAILRPSA